MNIFNNVYKISHRGRVGNVLQRPTLGSKSVGRCDLKVQKTRILAFLAPKQGGRAYTQGYVRCSGDSVPWNPWDSVPLGFDTPGAYTPGGYVRCPGTLGIRRPGLGALVPLGFGALHTEASVRLKPNLNRHTRGGYVLG